MKTVRQSSYVATLLIVALLVIMPTAGAQQEDQSAGTTAPNVWTVSIQDYFFDPADAAIGPGDSIVFVNEGAEPHTVTADDGQFDSGPLNPGESVAVSFEGSGTLTYYCALHPEMVGSVTVGGDSGGETSTPAQTTSGPTQTPGETIDVPGGTLTHNETMG